jgi:hypothetical protein
MAKEDIWVSPRPDGDWVVQREGSERASFKVPNKEEAKALARDMGRRDHVEVFIQRRNGTIENRNSFGHDPIPPRDKKP